MSFGGPEGPADVDAISRHVTQGAQIPRERLARRWRTNYDPIRGREGPINAQNRALNRKARGRSSAAHGPALPVLLRQPQLAPVRPPTQSVRNA